MSHGFASGSFLLHLLVVMCTCGKGDKYLLSTIGDDISKQTNLLRLHSMDADDISNTGSLGPQEKHKENFHAHPSSHMDHLDPSLLVFLTLKDLKLGNIMPVYFPNRDPLNSPKFIPREEADSIPFSSKHIKYLLKFFSFSPSSPQAKAMEDTLRQCETQPIKGETKFCATSLESLLDFTRVIFGVNTHLKVLATKHLTKSTTLFQKYTITKIPKEIPAAKMVACHTMPYPYAVLYCHSQEIKNRVFEVSLAGENGDLVEAIVVCHMNTSEWSPEHVSFRVLGVEPGFAPVCHFFPADNQVWVPKPI